jgi:dTDP-4-dehydrorhamnose 3,5-epimerase
MKLSKTPLVGTLVIEPKVFSDDRGFFLESYNEKAFHGLGMGAKFVQDNHSYSKKGVLRGLHYQVERTQGKLVRVVEGEILDVFVDLRRSSPSFGRWHSVKLSGGNKRQVWIPAGLAHGFLVLSEGAHVLYKSTEFYFPEHERTVLWNDSELNIDWDGVREPLLSEKDKKGRPFKEADLFP